MDNRKNIQLDPDDWKLAHAHMSVSYVPESIETDGITINCSLYSRIYLALQLTYTETLALVKTLRQNSVIEQATAPDNIHPCRDDNALS